MVDGKVREGALKFFYSMGEVSRLAEVRANLGWDFTDVHEAKELNLTHNLIAPQAGFGDLMEIYDRDGVLSFKKRIADYIKKHGDFKDYDGLKFGEVVAALQDGKAGSALTAVKPTPGMQTFIDSHPDLLSRAYDTEFQLIRRLYTDKDQLIDDKKQTEEEIARKGSKRCDFVKHVFKIQSVAHLYQQGKFNEFLRRTEFRLINAQDKVRIRHCIDTIENMSASSIIDVINYAHDQGLCLKDDRYAAFCDQKAYLFERLASVPFSSFKNLFEYLEGRTTFSTQHKIKGSEFERVLVVLDAGGWNNYNFKYLFEGGGTESVRERTGKLFYVCCTRAKQELAVYFQNPTSAVLAKGEAWFGKDNVVEV